jgi:hypothetical protein
MTLDQKQRIKDAALQVIVEDFHQDFVKAFEENYLFVGELSAQANNGIRNALTHLAIALTTDADEIVVEVEIVRARKHVVFATYDCLSVLLIKRVEFLENYIEAMEEGRREFIGRVRERLLDIKRRQGTILIQNFVRIDDDDKLKSKNDIIAEIDSITNTNNELGELLDACSQFHADLKTNFPVPDFVLKLAAIGMLRKAVGWVRRYIVLIVVVPFLINIIAGIILLLWGHHISRLMSSTEKPSPAQTVPQTVINPPQSNSGPPPPPAR